MPAAARSLGWAVVANNIEALKILLDCGYGPAAMLVAIGASSRWLVAKGVLWAMGLEGMDGGWGKMELSEGRSFVEGGWTLIKEWGGRMGGL